jgi:hypothetical protein
MVGTQPCLPQAGPAVGAGAEGHSRLTFDPTGGGQEQVMFFFFSNTLGWLPSLLLSLVVTGVLLLIFGVL